ncbi:MAG TPA: tail fiber domain-containing protein [Chthoniobacterales bacterium]
MKTVITSNSSLLTTLRSRSALILIALTLMAFVLPQRTQAVNPPPDGGYPGGNTAEGQDALLTLTSGTFNTALGFLSLRSNTQSKFNTGVGAGTLLANTANDNTGTGAGALFSNTAGSDNTANGTFALFSNTTGTENAACGSKALLSSTTGGGNTAVGFNALVNNTTGVTNTAVGFNSGFGVTTADNVIVIGTNVAGQNLDHSCFIGEIFGATSTNGAAVFINSDGRLGTVTSSKRFKDAIEPIDQASETLFALKPVKFHYKKEIDPTRKSQFGLVAEDVEKVDPALVVRDKDGKPYSVRYDQVNAMLLNEFLKEHKKIEEQHDKIEKQEATITGLKSDLAEQHALIQTLTAGLQKVSAQVGVSVSAAKVIATEQPTGKRKNDKSE